MSKKKPMNDEVVEDIYSLLSEFNARLAQLEEASVSKTEKSEFESQGEYSEEDEKEAESAEYDQLLAEKEERNSPFETFCEYFQTTSDWPVYPQAWEAWNGAVELVATYVVNHVLLDYDEKMHPDIWEEYQQKIIDKFKEK